jgi:hypothetical protein
MRQIFTVRAPLIAGCLMFSTALAAAQNVVRSFDGDSGPGLAACQSGVTHCDRPEMDVAVNGKQVVQVTWQNVRIYGYSGRLLRSTPMSTLIRNAGLNPIPPKLQGPYEPHVVYNEFIRRWIITVTGLNDCLLVSASSDAAGSWGGVYVSCLQGGPCLSTDAGIHLGYDRNGIYTCAVHVGDDNPNTIPGYAYDCFAIPPREVQAIAKGTAPAHINRAHNLPLDVIPAIDHNRSKPAQAPAFFAAKSCDRATAGGCQNSRNDAFHWVVDTFTWNGTGGSYNSGGEQAIKTGIGSKGDLWLYNKPCCGAMGSIAQLGSGMPLRADESHRLANLVQFGTHLHGVLGSGPCTSACGPQGTDASNVMFWADLDCSKTTGCVVSQTAKISGAGFNPEFATVGVDRAGNVGIVAASSTSTTDLSLLLWTHAAGDPANTFSGPTTVVSGTQPYTCLNNRDFVPMGNAVGVLTALDPVDGTKLWTTGQWSDDAARCMWKTRIVEYQAGPAGR